MRFIHAGYNIWTNSIDVTAFENYILRIDYNKTEEGLRVTQYSQFALSSLTIDDPLKYVSLVLTGMIQEWVDEEEEKWVI